jgi:hypothetical protein
MKQDKQENDRKFISPQKLAANRRNPVPHLTALSKVAKPGATSTVGGREMENKTVTPASLNRSVQTNATRSTASNKVARPDATSPLLEKRERTGAKVIAQRAGATARVPQAVKPGVAPSPFSPLRRKPVPHLPRRRRKLELASNAISCD